MCERFAVSKWLPGSAGPASYESSDSWLAFMMNGSLEVGNVCACSVSKMTPEIHGDTSTLHSRQHRNIWDLHVPNVSWEFSFLTFLAFLKFQNFRFLSAPRSDFHWMHKIVEATKKWAAVEKVSHAFDSSAIYLEMSI